MDKTFSDKIFEIFHAERYTKIPAKNLCLYGAGTLGKKLTTLLVNAGTPPLCLTDGDPEKWGIKVAGIPIRSPQDAAKRFGQTATFVVTAFNRALEADFNEIAAFLKNLNITTIVPYPLCALNFPDDLLPHFAQGSPTCLEDDFEAIVTAGNLFSDAMSQSFFLDMLKVSTTAAYASFTPPSTQKEPYFIAEAMRDLGRIHMVDCGAYNGDTLKSFLDSYGGSRLGSWHAFEPDPKNFEQLEIFVESLPDELKKNIFLYNCATGDKSQQIEFISGLGEGSTLVVDDSSGSAKITIQTRPIDSVLQNKEINFIKMDVEGYESESLTGAAETIANQKPALAICVYHKPKDFFQIPNQITHFGGRMDTPTQYLMRRTCAYFYETVFFAIPR